MAAHLHGGLRAKLGLAPAWVKLLIDVDEQTGQAARSETMVPANANAKDYAAGVTYTFTTPEALARPQLPGTPPATTTRPTP